MVNCWLFRCWMSKCKNYKKVLLTFALGINCSFVCKVCWQYVGTYCQIMLRILISLFLFLTFLVILIYITLLELPGYESQVSNKINNPMPMGNMTLINITNFKFLINNNICDVSNINIVTIIYSSAQNAEARDNIRYSWYYHSTYCHDGWNVIILKWMDNRHLTFRKSWGTPKIPGVETRLVFLFGRGVLPFIPGGILNIPHKFRDQDGTFRIHSG